MFAKSKSELVKMSGDNDKDKIQNEQKDDDINIDEIVKIIAPEDLGTAKKGGQTVKPSEIKTSEKKEAVKPAQAATPPRNVVPPTQIPRGPVNKDPVRAESVKPPQGLKVPPGKEDEGLNKLGTKVEEVYGHLDQLSRSIAQLNQDLQNRTMIISNEMDKLASNLKDASLIIEQAKDSIQARLPSSQPAAGAGREPSYGTLSRQQPPPQQTYQPPPQSYQPPPPQNYPPPQYGYQQQPPQQYQQGPPPQQGYYQSPPQQQGFFQQPPQAPPPPGVSPEDAVTRGAESLRGTVFDDVVSALGQVASIVFSRLLDAREKILRIDPSFPVQEMDPTLSELRANPRMKLSQVDKRKIVERMLYWASRLPRPP
jgi:hypothetical protein